MNKTLWILFTLILVIMTIQGATAANNLTMLNTSLSLVWSMDDADILATYNQNDLVGTNDGVGTNTPTTGQAGILNEAYGFASATSEYMVATNAGLSAGDFTICSWINRTSTGSTEMIVSQRQGAGTEALQTFFFTDSKIYARVWDTGGDRLGRITTSAFTDTTDFHHICFVYDDTTPDLTVYYDGAAQADTTSDSGVFNAGTRRDGDKLEYFSQVAGTNTLDGTGDELTVWTRALNTTEIGWLYNNSYGLTYTNGWYNATAAAPAAAFRNVTVRIKNEINNTYISGFSVNATGNGTTLTAHNNTGNIVNFLNLNNSIYNFTIGNFTIQTHYSQTILNHNTTADASAETTTWQAWLNISIQDLEGNTLSGTGWRVINNQLQNASTLPILIKANTKGNTIKANHSFYYDVWETHSATALQVNNVVHNPATNAYIRYRGETTGAIYAAQCGYGSGYLSKVEDGDWDYYAITNNTLLQCDGGDAYLPLNWTPVINSSGPINTTTILQEYYLNLNLTQNATGYVIWHLPNTQGDCCRYPFDNASSGYNATVFTWVKASNEFTSGDTVSVIFNKYGLTTNATQIYQYIAASDTVESSGVYVEDILNRLIYVTVEDTGGAIIEDATVTFYRTVNVINGSGVNIPISSKIVTTSQAGTSTPGDPVWLDGFGTYLYVVTANGYVTKRGSLPAYTWLGDETLRIRLTPETQSGSYLWQTFGPRWHRNESSIFLVSGRKGESRIYWNTSTTPSVTYDVTSNGYASFALVRGTHYTAGQNVTIYFYNYTDTAGYEQQSTYTISYDDGRVKDFVSNIDDTYRPLPIIAFIILILLSGVLGRIIKREGVQGTGYYWFTGGTLLMSVWFSPLIWVAVVSILTMIGNLVFAVTRD